MSFKMDYPVRIIPAKQKIIFLIPEKTPDSVRFIKKRGGASIKVYAEYSTVAGLFSINPDIFQNRAKTNLDGISVILTEGKVKIFVIPIPGVTMA